MDLEEERGRGAVSPVWLSRADDRDRVDVGGGAGGPHGGAPSKRSEGGGEGSEPSTSSKAAGDYCVRCSCSVGG